MILEGFGPCRIFSVCLAFLWIFPQYLFKNWVFAFGNFLKISLCPSVFIPSFSFLRALVSPVSCLSCAPCSSSFNPFVSFCWQNTVKWSWQRLLTQPCHEAYDKLHLHVLGVCVFFNLRTVMSHIGDIKWVTGGMMCHLRNILFKNLVSLLLCMTAFLYLNNLYIKIMTDWVCF